MTRASGVQHGAVQRNQQDQQDDDGRADSEGQHIVDCRAGSLADRARDFDTQGHDRHAINVVEYADDLGGLASDGDVFVGDRFAIEPQHRFGAQVAADGRERDLGLRPGADFRDVLVGQQPPHQHHAARRALSEAVKNGCDRSQHHAAVGRNQALSRPAALQILPPDEVVRQRALWKQVQGHEGPGVGIHRFRQDDGAVEIDEGERCQAQLLHRGLAQVVLLELRVVVPDELVSVFPVAPVRGRNLDLVQGLVEAVFDALHGRARRVELDFLETRQQERLPDAPLDESEGDEHGGEQRDDFGAYLHESAGI